MWYIGIDIGSTCAKTVVMDAHENIVLKWVQPTGWSSPYVAEEIRKKLCENGYLSETDSEEHSRAIITATGYGRVSVPYADYTVTEITCHAKGASWLFRSPALCVIDIGGQDTKVIRVNQGTVADFVMNDKCSAGTGRFLEVMGNSMGLGPAEVCEAAREGSGVKISSMCTVFAESEVISLIGRGEERKNIAYAVVDSIADKVVSQSSRIYHQSDKVCLTGGLCECDYLREVLEEKLHTEITTNKDARFAGAIGASLRSKEKAVK